MTKYRLLLFFTILVCFSSKSVAQETSITNKGTKRPNIIFILTDDQRWNTTGYSGNKLAHTPEMDKLAHSGVVFNNAIATTPICAASRASIFSGLYERTHKYTFQSGDIKDEYMQYAFPKLLRDSGYYTAFFGKFGVKYKHLDQMYDEFDNYDRNDKYTDRRGYYYKKIGKDTVHLTRYTGQHAIDFIDKAPTDKPFCMQLSFSAPHAHDSAKEQYFWDKETDFVLDNTVIPPANYSDIKYFNKLPQKVKDGFNRLRWTWRFDDPEKYQRMVKGYYRMIAGVDLEITKIRNELEKKGIADNTVIILMGDNGYFLGERQLADKWLMYENSIRVPLIVYDPRIKDHKEVNEMALNIDIAPTIAALAGVKLPQTWHGKSLDALIATKEMSVKRDTILIEHIWEFKNIAPSEGVRTKDWKYFRYVNDKSIEELYNIQKDPDELDNLINNKKYQKIVNNLRLKCDELILKYRDPYSGVPSGLTIEYIRNTDEVLVKDATPKFAWIVPKEAVNQSAYQILVASSMANLDKNIADVWNSQEVRGNKSTNITYNGTNLNPGGKYFWKVRIWDNTNRTGEYSKPQSFQIATAGLGMATPNSIQKENIKPIEVTKKNSSYFIDFGKDAFAALKLTYNSKVASVLTIRLGEQLENGSINQKPIGSIRYQEIQLAVKPGNNSYQIPIEPNKRNTTNAAIRLPASTPVLMPFRYCEIENATEEITKEDLVQEVYYSYFDENQSSFTSSDANLNQVWDICKYTIKATSFAGLYVDGDRERIPYEADAYINQLSHYGVDREYPIARNTIEYFMEHPTWPTEWQLHMALLFYADYMYTGNTELIEKYYDQLKFKTLKSLANEEGLISSLKATPELMKSLGFVDPKAKLKDIVDWPPGQKDTEWKLSNPLGERDGYVFTPINTVVNCFFYRNMEIMAEFAKILHKNEDEAEFIELARKSKLSINTKLLDKNTGVYTDGEGTSHASLHANMMALAFNIVPKENQKKVVDFIKSRGMACSVYGAQYLLQGLYNAGEANYALELMTATNDRSWMNMIQKGSTMTLEAWDMKYKPNSDWNHAWGAAPANIIPMNMWGIQPKVAGGSIVSIRPQLSTLSASSIEVPMLMGNVKASYERPNKTSQLYHIELAANVSAELYLTYGPNDVVLLNGEKVNLTFDSIRLSAGKNKIELVVNTF